MGRSAWPTNSGSADCHAAVFRASEVASYTTGQLIVVDGGNTIREYKVELWQQIYPNP